MVAADPDVGVGRDAGSSLYRTADEEVSGRADADGFGMQPVLHLLLDVG